MNSIMINYDLIKPEASSDYKMLIEHIKSYTYWAKPLDSTWFVFTNKTVSQVLDDLQKFTDNNDKLFVVDITGRTWTSFNVSKDVTDWLKAK